jgi:hypothetical protein
VEKPKNKLTLEANYTKSSGNVGGRVITTTTVNSTVRFGFEGKIKLGRKIELTSFKFIYFDRSARKTARKYWVLKGEVAGEFTFMPSGGATFTLHNSVTAANPQQRYVYSTASIRGQLLAVTTRLGATSSVVARHVMEYFNHSNETWYEVPNYIGTSIGQVEVKARGSLNLPIVEVNWDHIYERPSQGNDKSEWSLVFGRITGSFLVEVQLKVKEKIVIGYTWTPKMATLLSGKIISLNSAFRTVAADLVEAPSGSN